jgi:hypothetical protein
MSHTYAILGISQAAYDEIAAKLRAAEYQHAFDGAVIDMHGIGLEVEAAPGAALDGAAPLQRYRCVSVRGGEPFFEAHADGHWVTWKDAISAREVSPSEKADLLRAARYLESDNDSDGEMNVVEALRIAGVLRRLAGTP